MPAPSPPILALRPPAPLLSSPPPQQSKAMGTSLLITLYGLDLWSLLTSWGSGIQALLEAQQTPSLSLQDLSAPGMCASQLLALNTTALLNISLTAQQLMPGLSYFAMDVAQLLRDYLNDSNIAVQVTDFCAGNRTAAPFIANRTLVNGPWPTLRVTINLLTTEPDSNKVTITTARQARARARARLPKPSQHHSQAGGWTGTAMQHLNMQRIGESKWRPLELCYWPDQGALPAKGKEYPGMGFKRLRDKPPKAQQQQQPAVAH
ncbi:hypothetical protein QJQ45_030209 [Haematococcus lacustris]|nr:hypothetical protein QJQ45_030209 [Haematococcus lacustris]